MPEADPVLTADPLWIFGYGSLIWNPEFPVAERRLARARGWRRSFCMWSIHHRGSEENPGLVLALDADAAGHCDGLAFRVEPGEEATTLAALRERELVSSAYIEVSVQLETAAGGIRALAYVVDRHHVQYTGALGLEEQAGIIAQAHGGRGPNRDYLWSTTQHLAELGIADPELDWLSDRVRRIAG
ncbi:gamma-glutamylcyclotransferase [Pseudomonas sp. GX19020]|uniref:gamma-glutamylcyclotransferase n=1 Tax=Pseudomonadota TaxID=1224 RepID=UPI0008971C08|nr:MULTISPECIES: gamma-glutamylcyclotransferase [Pseudomonadota]MCL4066500.1 gamma-glutamylcyclotransferase [Pseudomonas sp. GX19020]SEB39229.1 cation transport protein ChaC [Rhodobacter sp. 24-YEA-8]